jgi:hypothetical protein
MSTQLLNEQIYNKKQKFLHKMQIKCKLNAI